MNGNNEIPPLPSGVEIIDEAEKSPPIPAGVEILGEESPKKKEETALNPLLPKPISTSQPTVVASELLSTSGSYTSQLKSQAERPENEFEGIKKRMKDKFVKDELFLDQKSDGTINPNAAKNRDIFVNTLSKKGYSPFQVSELKKYASDVVDAQRTLKANSIKLADDINDVEAHYENARAQLKLGDYNAAKASFEKVLKNEEAFVPDQESFGARGDKPASAAYDKSYSLYGIGYALQQEGRQKEAIKYYKDAIAQNPKNEEAYRALAYASYKAGNKEDSSKLISAANEVKEQLAQEEANKTYRLGEDPAEIAKAQYAKDVLGLTEALFLGKDTEKLGPLAAVFAPASFAGRFVTGMEGGFDKIQEGVKDFSKGDKSTGVAKSVLGAAELGFATMRAASPIAFAAWDIGIETGEEVLPESIINAVMQPATTIANNFMDAEQRSNATNAWLQVGDIIGNLYLIKKGEGVVKGEGKSVSPDKTYEKFKNNEPLQPIETREITDAIKEATPQEIAKAYDMVQAKPKDEVISQLENKKNEMSLSAEKLESLEAKEIAKKEIAKIDEQIKNRENEIIDISTEEAIEDTRMAEIDESISLLEKDLSNLNEDSDLYKLTKSELNSKRAQKEQLTKTKTNESEKENGIQEGGENGKEVKPEGLQSEGEKGGQEVLVQKEGELLTPETGAAEAAPVISETKTEIIDDTQNKIGIPGEEQIGQEFIQEKPVEGASQEEVGPSRIFQETEEIASKKTDVIQKIIPLIDAETKLIPELNKEGVASAVRQLGDIYIKEGVVESTELSKMIRKDLEPIIDKSLLDEVLEGIFGKERGFSKSVQRAEPLKDVSAEALMAERGRYEPQKLQDGRELSDAQKLEQFNDLDKVAAFNDKSTGNFGVLAGIDLMQKAKAEGDNVRYTEIKNKLAESGTALGQMIRQYAELRKVDPETMVDVVEAKLEKLDKKLRPEDKIKLTELAEEQAKAVAEYGEFKKKYNLEDYNPENIKKLQELTEKAEDATNKFQSEINAVVPKDWDYLLGTILKGNLLSTLSIARNIGYNIMMAPITIPTKLSALGADYIASALSKKPREIYVDRLYLEEMAKGRKEGIKKGLSQLKKGVGMDNMTNSEYARGFQPLRSLKQLANSDMMAVDKNGKVSFNDKAKKAVEGIFGVNAEVMFRLLNVGDKPSSTGNYRGALYEIGRKKGLKGDELKKWLELPDEKSAKEALDVALVSTFQNEGVAAKTAQSIVQAAKVKNPSSAAGIAWNFLVDSVVPYVKTPTNLLSYTMDLAVPPVAFAKAAFYTKKGENRKAAIYAGRGITGMMISSLATTLYDNNIITGNVKPKGKEAEDAKLKAGAIPPLSFNMDAFKRWANGEDPSPRYGDESIPLQVMGIMGSALAVNANFKDKAKEKGVQYKRAEGGEVVEGEASGALDKAIDYPKFLGETLTYMLDQSFLKGSNEMINAIQKGDYDAWLANTLNSTSNVVIPNNLMSLNRISRDFKPRIKDDDELDVWLGNVIKNKTFQGATLPKQRGLFGELIPETPEDKNPFVYHFLDIARSKKANSELYLTIQNLYKNTMDRSVIPDTPMPIINIRKDRVKLDENQYDRYIEMVGMERLKRLNSPSVKSILENPSISNETKIRILKSQYEIGQKTALRLFQREVLD